MGFFSKSSDKSNDQESEKWKNKYLNLVDAQELTEKTHKLDQEILCKTIVRLSIAASGVDPQLEPYLERIRNHIKNGVDNTKLKAELESFTDALNRINTQPTDRKDTSKDIALLFAFLLQNYNSPKQQHELKKLKESCQPLEDPQILFSAIAKIIEEERSENQQAEQNSEEPALAEPPIDPIFVSAQLKQLLDHIEIPDEFVQQAQMLKQQLASHDMAQSLEPLINSVTSLLIEINAHSQPEQQEIDNFLAHINEQLTELGLALTDSGIALLDASMNRSMLDQSVSEKISDLESRSSSATQLEPLKQVISSHIAQITKEIQEHKQKEAEQREKHQRQLDELSQKIKVMETETGELQNKLILANTNALRDALTNLPNRLAYDERLAMEIARWQRYHAPLCLVIWDVDFFKKVNDQYGHQVGDKVLVHIANQFSEHIRRSDFIARFGGEEFVMLLPHTNKHSALKVTEKLRDQIEQASLETDQEAFKITVSCGITQFFKGDTPESAFERADQALYRAKEQGRNRCCVA